MSIVSDYLAKVSDAVKWALEDTSIASTLADDGGITSSELQALQGLIAPAITADEQATAAVGAHARATQAFQTALTGVEKDLSTLRRIMNDNLKRGDPLFSQLGLDEKQPKGQDELLAYAVRAFTNGTALTAQEGAVLATRKWATARFQAAWDKATAAQALNDDQESAKAAAIAATSNLYDQIDAVDDQYRPIAKDARLHLKGLPGALTKMQLARGVPDKPKRPTPYALRKQPTPNTLPPKPG